MGSPKIWASHFYFHFFDFTGARLLSTRQLFQTSLLLFILSTWLLSEKHGYFVVSAKTLIETSENFPEQICFTEDINHSPLYL